MSGIAAGSTVLDRQGGTTQPALRPPRRYVVVLHHDGITPLLVMIRVLTGAFGFNQDQALALAMDARRHRRVVLGHFSLEMAEAKVAVAQSILHEIGAATGVLLPLPMTIEEG